MEVSWSKSESKHGAVTFLGIAREDFATGDFVVGAERKPGGEVFDGRPLGSIGASFGEDHPDSDGVETMDLSEVDAGE